nr:tyrosine-type recombinase/integrase [Paenibacillus sp. PAMC 26794]
MSEKEVAQLLKSVTNPKHKTILFLTYSSGLRVGEVVRLCCTDLDIERQTLIVRQGKGQKDRRTLLSSLPWDIVQKYIDEYRPNRWLFPGNLLIDILLSGAYRRFLKKLDNAQEL